MKHEVLYKMLIMELLKKNNNIHANKQTATYGNDEVRYIREK